MDPKDVYGLTAKGSAELGAAGTFLSPTEVKVLVLTDGRSSVAQIMTGTPSLPEATVKQALEKLLRSGHIALAADLSAASMDLTLPQAESESDAGIDSLKNKGYYVRIARRAAGRRKLAAGERFSVLVVEDDPQLAKLLKMFLQMEDLASRVAGNREEIAAALNQTPKPDLVLLDVMLPDIDGFEVLAKMRENEDLKTVPVIMCTGKATREAVLNGLLRGADGYITKPFDVEMVLKAVKTVLGLPLIRSDGRVDESKDQAYQRLSKEFEELRAEYRAGMPAKLEKLGTLWARLASGSAGVQAVADLLRELHTIAGSAGSFGLPQLSEVARAAETFLAESTAKGAKLGPEDERQFNRLLGELRNASLPPKPRR